MGLEPELLNARTTFVAVQARLVFRSKADEEAVLELMRRFSAAYRWTYRRLLEGYDPNTLKRADGPMTKLFGLGRTYNEGVRDLAKWKLSALKKLGQAPEKIVFGGRGLFRRLGRKGNLRSRLEAKRLWWERRNGLLYCPGDRRMPSGNPNLRLHQAHGALRLRILLEGTPAKGRYVDALVQTSSPYLGTIAEVVDGRGVAPIGVHLRLRGGRVYAIFTRSVPLPQPYCTRQGGVLGVDVNAHPFHLALAVVNPDGGLRRYLTLSLEEADRIRERKRGEASANALGHFYWQVAHRVVDLAKEEGVAIAIENIRALPKGVRGDGDKRFRRKLHRFAYRAILERIVAVASREGVEVWGVNPAYTSVIGMLKYAPQLSLSKDVAAAYVIGRRALGLKERVPKRYLELLAHPDHWERVVSWFAEEWRALEERAGKEQNEYRLKRYRRKQEELEKAWDYLRKFVMESLEGAPVDPRKRGPTGAYASPSGGSRQEPQGGELPLWRALQVGVLLPLLGRKAPRDLSVLKPLLVGGAWEGGGGQRPGPERCAGPARMEPWRFAALALEDIARGEVAF